MAKQQVLNGEDEDQKDDDIVIVETDPNEAKKRAEEGERDEEHDEHEEGEDHEEEEPEERVVKRSDDDEGDDVDPERKALRERRKQEKLDRKRKKEEAIRRNNLEMEFLRKRNDDLERRINGIETNVTKQTQRDIDSEMERAKREFKMAEEVMAKAAAASNGEDMVRALGYRDAARDRFNELAAIKNQQQDRRPAAQPEVDPVVLRHAQSFISQNEWYDPNGKDEDSAIVLAIDNTLVREGYDPKSKEYWQELRARAAKRLPERFSDEDPPRANGAAKNGERVARGGPALGSGRNGAPASTRKEIYISPERKQAMIDAGVWEDPVLRQKMVKRFAQYDRNNRKS